MYLSPLTFLIENLPYYEEEVFIPCWEFSSDNKGHYLYVISYTDESESTEIRFINTLVFDGIRPLVVLRREPDTYVFNEGSYAVVNGVNTLLTIVEGYNAVLDLSASDAKLSDITEIVIFLPTSDIYGTAYISIDAYIDPLSDDSQLVTRVWKDYIDSTEVGFSSASLPAQASVFYALDDAVLEDPFSNLAIETVDVGDDISYISIYFGDLNYPELDELIILRLLQHETLSLVIVWSFDGVAPADIPTTLGLSLYEPAVGDVIDAPEVEVLSYSHTYDDDFVYTRIHFQVADPDYISDVELDRVYIYLETTGSPDSSIAGTIYDIRLYAGDSIVTPAGFTTAMIVHDPLSFSTFWGTPPD